MLNSPLIELRCARPIRRCRPNRPPSELAQRAALRRCTATSARARSASSSVGSGVARRYDDALGVAPGTERRARWRSTTSSRRRSCATTSSSTGGVGTIASQLGVHHSTVERVLGEAGVERERQRPRRPSKLDPYMAFITETLERFPTVMRWRRDVLALCPEQTKQLSGTDERIARADAA